MPDEELDLSELLDEEEEMADEETTPLNPEQQAEFNASAHQEATFGPDRIFVTFMPDGETGVPPRVDIARGDGVEYVRAKTVREGFTKQIWREAVRYARRTAGQPTAALKRARNLIEAGQ